MFISSIDLATLRLSRLLQASSMHCRMEQVYAGQQLADNMHPSCLCFWGWDAKGQGQGQKSVKIAAVCKVCWRGSAQL